MSIVTNLDLTQCDDPMQVKDRLLRLYKLSIRVP